MWLGKLEASCNSERWGNFAIDLGRFSKLIREGAPLTLKESHSTPSLDINTASSQSAKSQELYLHLFNHLLQSELAITILDIASILGV